MFKDYLVTDIEWDTEGETICLPLTVTLEDIDTYGDETEESAITDALSDIFGWAVLSCKYKEIVPE